VLRSLLYLLAGLVVLAFLIGAGGIIFRGKEYTIEELYAETRMQSVPPVRLKMVAISMNDGGERTDVSDFVELMKSDERTFEPAINRIRSNWHPGDTVMLVELQQFHEDYFKSHLIQTINEATGEAIGDDHEAQYQWVWKSAETVHPQYGEFKAAIYSEIDNRFGKFFDSDKKPLIALNEIRWWGARVDGIPPLANPKTLSAADANNLADSEIVFGIEVGGEARAYPRKFLGWHELVNDELGGTSICGAYSPLCESMIVFRCKLDGTQHEFGSSGFLYRSSKLIYDKKTYSMWSVFDGRPVVGPLADQNICLEREPVVTTNWGQWKKLHPSTRVLSRPASYRPNYLESGAYQDYLTTEQLVYSVPEVDSRLRSKAEVFVVGDHSIDHSEAADRPAPIAYSLALLLKNPVYVSESADKSLVVLTDSTGANRAYETRGVEFKQFDGESTVVDDRGRNWTVTEQKLVLDVPTELDKAASKTEKAEEVAAGSDESEFLRIPGHRAFWFGWYAAHPETQLIF
jgi:Protein of unknown function (DUF3179)